MVIAYRIFIILVLIGLLMPFPGFSQTAESLRQLIDEKNAELQELLEQREALEQELQKTNQKSTTLQREINNLTYNINQLEISIKANRLVIEKLGLEVESLEGEISNIENGIDLRKEAIAKLFVELQQRDEENFLVIFLKNQSLAESVSAAQEIADLNNGLASEVSQLREFRIELAQRLEELNNKKRSREVERINLSNRQYILQDQKALNQQFLTQTRNQERTYQQQIDELEKKQEEIGQILADLEDQLRKAFDPSLLPIKRPGVLALPVASPYVTQDYGATEFAQRAYRTKFHNGVDFRAPVGTPILAALDGQVIAVDNNDRGTSRWARYQYGKYVLIKHDNNLTTLYAHLSRFAVQKGDLVKRGDIIGYSGETGYSYGPHLHFTVYWSDSVQFKSIPPAAGLVPIGVTIDPTDYLPNL